MTLREIETLAAQFIDRSLPLKKWTHEAHLVVAIWHLYHNSKEEATCYLRSRIIAYNVSVGTANTPKSGYHETITLFWILIIHDYVQKHSNLSLEKLTNDFLKSKWAAKDILFEYYDKDLLFSVKARAKWVVPDLETKKI